LSEDDYPVDDGRRYGMLGRRETSMGADASIPLFLDGWSLDAHCDGSRSISRNKSLTNTVDGDWSVKDDSFFISHGGSLNLSLIPGVWTGSVGFERQRERSRYEYYDTGASASTTLSDLPQDWAAVNEFSVGSALKPSAMMKFGVRYRYLEYKAFDLAKTDLSNSAGFPFPVATYLGPGLEPFSASVMTMTMSVLW
ncbi:MAG: hypothetical protein AABZ44_06820, partial [Elusimicrobiota bacterium]